MCANLSFCPLLHLSTLLCAQRTCQTSRTAESLPWFRFFFSVLKTFPPSQVRGRVPGRERAENWECARARPQLSWKGSESVSKHLYSVFIGIIFGSRASCFTSCVICSVSRQLGRLVAWSGFICWDEETGRVGLLHLHTAQAFPKVFHSLKVKKKHSDTPESCKILREDVS